MLTAVVVFLRTTDAHTGQSAVERVAVNGVSISVQPAGRGVVENASTTCWADQVAVG